MNIIHENRMTSFWGSRYYPHLSCQPVSSSRRVYVSVIIYLTIIRRIKKGKTSLHLTNHRLTIYCFIIIMVVRPRHYSAWNSIFKSRIIINTSKSLTGGKPAKLHKWIKLTKQYDIKELGCVFTHIFYDARLNRAFF